MEFLIYLITRLDNIQTFCAYVCGITSTGLLMYFIFFVNSSKEERIETTKTFGKSKNRAVFALFLSCFILVFLPSKDEAISIYVGGKALNYVESDTSLAKIPYQTTKLITDYLDKKIKESK